MWSRFSDFLDGFELWGTEVTPYGSIFIVIIVSFIVFSACVGLVGIGSERVHEYQSRRKHRKEVASFLLSGNWHWFPLTYQSLQGKTPARYKRKVSSELLEARQWVSSSSGEYLERFDGEELWGEVVGVHWGRWGANHSTPLPPAFISIEVIIDEMIRQFGERFAQRIFTVELDPMVLDALKRERFARLAEHTVKAQQSPSTNALPGKSSYARYLLTSEWQSKRRQAIGRALGRCQICNSTQRLQVHHRTYDRIFNESPEDLIVLCEQCHKLFHEGGRMPSKQL